MKKVNSALHRMPMNALITIPIHTGVLTGVSLSIQYACDENFRKNSNFWESLNKEIKQISILVTGLYMAGYMHQTIKEHYMKDRPVVVDIKHGANGELDIVVKEPQE